MQKLLLVFTLAISSIFMQAQTTLVPFSGSDTTVACSGTVQDHAGNSNYSNYASGYLVIDPSGNSTVSLTFSQFSTESCCDRVWVYDGVGITGTLLGYYGGSSLPNSGNVIVSTSGAMTVRFTSDGSYTSSGFTASWTASGGSGTPLATLSISNTNPPLNAPIQFTNTSSFGTNIWLFGDGNSSTSANATHSYSSPGTYQARLVVENCQGAIDTSNMVSISVQSSPNGTLSLDTVKTTIPCGTSNSTSFQIGNTGSGSMLYSLNLVPSQSSSSFRADFEGTGLNGFINQAPIYYNTTLKTNGAPQGNQYLEFTGDGNVNDGLKATFTPSQPTEVRYRVKHEYNGYYNGAVEIGGLNGLSFKKIFNSVYYYGSLRLYYGNGFGGFMYYNYPATLGQWNLVELKNIDYSSQTYDIYVDGSLIVSNASFYYQTSTLSQIEVFNNYLGTIGLDDLYVGNTTALNAVTFSPNSGTISSSGNTSVFININATGLNAGVYYLDFEISSNDPALDGTILPLELTVTGTANLIQSSTALGYGSVYNTQTFTDSVLLFNSGCDTLNFTSFSTTDNALGVLTPVFNLAPGDSSFVHFSFTPTTIGAYYDSLLFNGADTNSFVQVTAQVLGAPIVNTDPTTLNLSYTGCPDTIPFNLTIFNTGLSQLNWGASSQLSGSNFDDFEASTINTSLWSNWTSGVSVGSSCGTINGNQTLIFNGSGSRYIETVPLNTSAGGTIEFEYRNACELADGGEGLYIMYSLNNGISWSQIQYYYTSNTFTTFTASMPIPLAAQTTNVRYRIQQSSNSGQGFDNWIIDDFSISSAVNNTVIFTPDTGFVSVADSTQILGEIMAAGMTDGTYNFPVYISSNDPVTPLVTIPVTLTITGVAGVDVPVSCTTADTIIEQTVVLDSAMIVNDGCADLLITNVTTSTNQFTPITTSLTVAPGDTAHLHFEFNPTSTGLKLDSLQLASNITTPGICIQGFALGAPVINASNNLIQATLTSCSDSVIVPYTIANTGASPLVFQMGGTFQDTIRILALTTGYNFSYYNNALNALAAHMTVPYLVTPLFTTSATVLNNALQETDVLWITPLTSNYSSTYALFAPTVQAFLNDGGRMIVSGTYQTASILNLGVFTGSTGYNIDYGGLSMEVASNFAGHPVVQGLGANPLSSYRTYYYTISNAGARKFLNRTTVSNYLALTEVDYGSGEALWIGFDHYFSTTENSLVFSNAMQHYGSYGSNLPDWLTANPDSGSVSVNDSITVNLMFKANGYGSGVYTDTLKIASNDPLNPIISVPVQLTINGSAEIDVTPNCVDFDTTFVGVITYKPSPIYNGGCDTLIIDSVHSSSGNYSIQGLPISIAPNDSATVNLAFTPDTIGLSQDTLYLYSNAASAPGICVNGWGLGAPLVNPTSDTLKLTVNKCDGFTQIPFTFQNSGQGVLNYILKERSIYRETSIQNYTTTYATTTHNFLNTPATADTIFFTTVVNGDYNSDFGGEYYTMRAENYYLNIFDNNAPDGTNDTSYGFYTGPNITNWLSDGQLNVTIANAYGVGINVGQDMHLVEVRIESTPTWLTILSSKTGTLNIGASTNKTVLINVNSLLVGNYESSIIIESNDPLKPYYTVYVELEVVDKPTMEIPNNCINYGVVNGIAPITDSVMVVNTGCKPLVINNLQFANPVFTSSITNLTIPTKDTGYIPVTLTPTQAATLNSNLLVYSNDTNLSVCLTATINLAPIASFDYSITDECEGEVDFSDLSSNSPTSWSWNFGDGTTSGQQNPVHNYERPGIYTASLYASNNGGTDTATRTLDMTKVLYVNFSRPDTIRRGVPAQFYDSSQVATSWQWYFGDGGNSTLQNPIHTYSSQGTYFMTMVATNTDCSRSISRQITVLGGIGLDEDEQEVSIKVYPVPARESVYVEWGTNQRFEQAIVLDITGKQIAAFEVHNRSSLSVNTEDFSDGMYFIHLVDKNGQAIARRFVVRK